MKKLSISPLARSIGAVVALTFSFSQSAFPATIKWNGINGGSFPNAGWNLGSNWDSGTIPGVNDIAFFSNPLTGGAVSLNANQSVLGLQMAAGNPNVTINSGTGTNTLTLGTSGISGAGGGNLTFNAGVVLNGNQTWSNTNQEIVINGTLTGTGNLVVSTRFIAIGGAAINVTGSATLNGQTDINANFANGFSNGLIVGNTNLGVQGAFTVDKAITFVGNGANWYTNNSTQILSGAVTGGTMNSNGTGSLTLTGTANNTGLTLITPIGTTVLSKTSSADVHAVGGNLTLANNSTLRLAGTGNDQIKDTGTVTMNAGSTFDLNGTSETINGFTGTGTVTNTLAATTSTLTVGAGGTGGTFTGVIQNGAGTVGLTKVGNGTLILTAANTYTGDTNVNGGILRLNYQANNLANVLSPSSAINFSGGTLDINGPSAGTTLTLSAMNLNGGASGLTLTSNGGATSVVLNAINRTPGSTVNFGLPASGTISTTTANANFAGGQQTILGGYATVGLSSWAVSGTGANPGNITALNAFNPSFAAGADVESGTGTITPGAMTVNSIRFNGAGSTTVNTAGNLVVATGGILMAPGVGGNSISINNNTLTSGNGQNLILHQNAIGTMTIGSAIVNNGATKIGLVKSGTGPLTLSGANTYTGDTYLNGGTTTVNTTSSLGVGSAVTLKGGATLVFNNLGAQINLQAIGATATALTAPQPASLAIDGNIGTRWESVQGAGADPQWIYLDLKSVYNIASVNIAWEAANARNMQLQTATSNASAPNQSGPGSTATNGWTTVLNVVNQNPAVGGTFTTYNLPGGTSGQYLAMYGTARNLDYGYSIYEIQVFQAASAAAQSIGSLSSTDLTSTVNIGSLLTLTTGTDDSSTSFAGAITGSGNLIKAGNGTFTMAGANNYLGTTAVNAGVLKLGQAGALGNGATNSASVTVLNLAALDLGGSTPTAIIPLNLNGASASAVGALTNSSSTAAGWGGAVTLQSNSSIGGNAGAVSLTGTVNGAFSLTKVGTNTLTLSGTNSYTGATVVNGGILKLGGVGALGNGTNNTSGVTVNNLGALDLNAIVPTASVPLNLNGSLSATIGALTNSSNTAASWGAAITLQSDASIGGNGGGIVLTNPINGGSFGLTKVGTDMLTLSATNAYTGATVVGGGILKLGAAGALGSVGTHTSSVTVNNLGALDLNAIVPTATVALNLTGSFSASVGALTNSNASAATWSSPITLQSTSSIGGNNGDIALTAAVSGSATGLTKVGSNTLTLSGTNSYTGGTVVNGGILKVGAAGALGGTSSVTVNVLGTLDFNGITPAGATPLNLNGSFAPTIGALTNSSATAVSTNSAVTLQSDSSIGGDNGNLTLTGSINGATFGLTKVGSDTLTLSGVQNYASLTTNGGTTKLNATLGSGSSSLNAFAGTTTIGTSQTLSALNIGADAVVTMSASPSFAGVAAVPEPGSVTLLAFAALGLVTRRRRCRK